MPLEDDKAIALALSLKKVKQELVDRIEGLYDRPTIKGRDGVDGKDGRDGVDGKDGRDGVDGKDGRDGVDGRDGRDGIDGQDGVDGRGIAEAFLGLDNHLVIRYTDGTEDDVGTLGSALKGNTYLSTTYQTTINNEGGGNGGGNNGGSEPPAVSINADLPFFVDGSETIILTNNAQSPIFMNTKIDGIVVNRGFIIEVF